MKSSGRLPSVDCSAPVTAGPKRAPTDSVAIADRPGDAAERRAVTTKTTTGSASA
jgi:hypothetical protein